MCACMYVCMNMYICVHVHMHLSQWEWPICACCSMISCPSPCSLLHAPPHFPANFLKHNTSLSELGLWECGLGDEAICELCGGLKQCKLKKLNLEDNPFGEKGARSLADVIKDNPTLKRLGMDDCGGISDGGVQYLMDAMMSNTTLEMISLSDKYRHLVPHILDHRVKCDEYL